MVEAYTSLQKETYTVRGANGVGNSETKIKIKKTLQLIFYFTNDRFLQIHQT